MLDSRQFTTVMELLRITELSQDIKDDYLSMYTEMYLVCDKDKREALEEEFRKKIKPFYFAIKNFYETTISRRIF